ncbi:MAG TPA: hypothetical protein VFU05_13580 [Cyclobacteriaceae bacterium]|nr:hypothetical protein [Cyclobacteriaceae bacterium]
MSKKGKRTLRPVQIKAHPYVGSKAGYFHRWCDEAVIRGPHDSTVVRTYGLIELNDGDLTFIEPQYLKFLKPLPKLEST